MVPGNLAKAQGFGLLDEGIEDTLYDSQAIRGFIRIDLGRESAPDATKLLNFRRLLEDASHQIHLQCFLVDTKNSSGYAGEILIERVGSRMLAVEVRN